MDDQTSSSSNITPLSLRRGNGDTLRDPVIMAVEEDSSLEKKNCCDGCFPRTLLVLFNIIFVMVGCILISLAIWTVVNPSSLYSTLKGLDAAVADVTKGTFDAVILGSAGALILVPGLLGSCGAVLRQPCILYTYAFIVATSLLLQIGCGLGLTLYKNETDLAVRGWLQKNIRGDYSSTKDTESPAAVWDQIFLRLECCGVNNFSDFEGSRYHRETGNIYPPSCCQTGVLQGVPCKPYANGCFNIIIAEMMNWRITIGSTILGFAAIQLMAIILSVYIARYRQSSKLS